MIPKNLSELVTFVPNKTEPIHNWFYYKEGYSRKLVDWLVDEYELQEPVFDPFCGVGTTLLACKQRGIESIGMDVSPLACLASKVKTRNYDTEQLESQLRELEALSPQPIEKIPIDTKVRKLFYHNALETIWFYKEQIESLRDEELRDFFLLALIDTSGQSANIEKVGGSLRKKKKPNVPVRELFLRKAKRMILDAQAHPLPDADAQVIQGDCRFDQLEPESVGSIITSPPYLNKIEYTRIYGIELALFFGYQQKGLRAFVGDNPKVQPRAELAKLPLIAQAYFSDLDRVLGNCLQALRPKGRMIINVAGGCLPEGTVNSPQILGKLAQMHGFGLKQDIPCRSIQCVSPHGRRIGNTSENLLVLQKG
ncbi:MAG: hypothetical protein Q7R47_01515 [Candidatus Diapherotrites archaeon]|nr:hypothetical protein [Candidatus Diapherotrites archaeon]